MSRKAKMPTDKLPAGVLVHDIHAAKGAAVGARWFWRVRDPVRRAYVAKSWADYDQGKEWAIDQHHKLAVGLATSSQASMTEIGKAYDGMLATRGRTKRYRATVKHVVAALVEAGADDLKHPLFPDRVEAWLGSLMAQRHNQKKATPASPALKNQFLTITKSLVGYALDRRLIPHDPLAIVHGFDRAKSSKPVFTVPELRLMLSDESRMRSTLERRSVVDAVARHGGDKQAAADELKVHRATVYNWLNKAETPDDPWWLYTVLAIYLGARPTEVRNLRWSHIDWRNMDVLLPADHPGNKTGVERRIPIMPELAEILEDRKRVGSMHILHPSIPAMREDTATRAFQWYAQRCGASIADAKKRKRGPHSLRHNCGALLTACGFQDMAVLLHLGHDNVKVSKEYRRSAPGFKTDVAGWGQDFWLRRDPLAAGRKAGG